MEKVQINKKYLNKNKKNYGNIVLNVEPELYEKLLEKGKFNVGWKICNIFDYVNIIRCYKCAGYNHFAKDCTDVEACGKCAGEHATAECDGSDEKCINCIKAVKKLKIELDVNHTAFDRSCSKYQRILEKQRTRVKYI